MKHLPHIAAKLFATPTLLTPQHHAFLCGRVEAWLANPGGGQTALASDGPQAAAPQKRFYPQYGQYAEPEDNEGILFIDQLRMVNDNTVIIPVHGTLVAHPEDIAMSECGCAMEDLCAAIDKAENDAEVETVIYDFRTPGGSVTMIPETGRKIRFSKKNTVAFTDSQCCSGGLWLAEQCRRFYATRSSQVGSCGVYTMCLDMSEALAKDGIKINAIFAGKFKLLGAYWKPLEDEERAILQAGVDKIRGQFIESVNTYRQIPDEACGNGLSFDGEEAVERGFVDGVVEGIEDVLDGIAE